MSSIVHKENLLPTVYVGIPAHNEAKNIARLLDSIIKQKQDNFILQAVVVACDGCTDSTAEVVKNYSLAYPFIQVIDDLARLGKAGRLNNFFKISESDIFVSFDSDVVLVNDSVIVNLVKEFEEADIGLVGGRGIPFPVKEFVPKIAEVSDKLWYEIRKDLNYGNNIHNLVGCINALAKDFYKTLAIPAGIIAEDEYLFYAAKRAGLEFRFAKNAEVYYWPPNNFKDFFMQSARFISSKDQIVSYFGQAIKEDYQVPYPKKVKALFLTFLHEPFFLPLAVIFQLVLRLNLKRYKQDPNGLWTRIESPKS